MLKIRQNSWHYWIWKLGRDYHSRPHNLCKYFWHIILFKIVPALIVAGLVLAGVIGIGYAMYTNPGEFAQVVLLLCLSCLLAIALIFLVKMAVDRYDKRQKVKQDYAYLVLMGKAEPLPKKEPSPFWLWLKARKQKACPLIEVVDE